MRASISIRGADANGNTDSESDRLSSGMDLLDAAYHTGHQYPGGIPALAARMGLSQNVLASKLNLNSDTHHLTLRQAQTMMDVTDNDAILYSMAEHRGYDLVRTIPANTERADSLFWQAAAAFAQLQEAVADAMQNGVTRNSLRRVSNQASDAMAHMHNLVGAVAAQLPPAPQEAKQ
jgi:hypothetical protein